MLLVIQRALLVLPFALNHLGRRILPKEDRAGSIETPGPAAATTS